MRLQLQYMRDDEPCSNCLPGRILSGIRPGELCAFLPYKHRRSNRQTPVERESNRFMRSDVEFLVSGHAESVSRA